MFAPLRSTVRLVLPTHLVSTRLRLRVAAMVVLPLWTLVGGSPAPLWAQTVSGVAVESESGSPIAGGFVSLLDGSGVQVSSTLTGADGAYTLTAPAGGTYTLELERIGYETWRSGPVELEAGETVSRRLAVSVRAVGVEELTVSVESACEVSPGSGERVYAAWREIEKALDVARWTAEPGRIRFELKVWERQLDRLQRVVEDQRSETGWKTGRATFETLAPERLAEEGYVHREDGRFRYYAPDAGTLLSESFQASHCFRVVRGVGEEEGLLGLEFEPVEVGRVPDVAGALWLDPSTGELRHLAFRYVDVEVVGLPEEHEARGRVEYRQLPPGIWLVSRWWIRNPVLAQTDTRGVGGVARMSLRGYREDGGEITRLELAGGRELDLRSFGTVTGRLLSGTGEALPGATAYLLGTVHVTESDEAGRYRFEGVEPGRYTLKLRHPDPRLDGLESRGEEVVVTGGERTALDVRFPDAWAVERICGAPGGAVVGRVSAAGRADEEAVPAGALVFLDGAAGERRAVEVDSTGRFVACDLPAPGAVTLQASGAGADSAAALLSDPVRVAIGETGLAFAELDVSAETFGAAEALRAEGATLRGTVRSAETGEPVRGARVRLLEADAEALTGADGTFEIAAVPRGEYRLVTERLGLASDTALVDLTGNAAQVAVLTLQTRPVSLPTLEVEIERIYANPWIQGFYDRMKKGLGDFITKEDLEYADVISNFRRIPNVQIEQCVEAGLRKPNCWTLNIHRGARLGPPCEPQIFLNGVLITNQLKVPGEETTFTRIQKLPRDMIEGIEVHRNPATAPGRYRTIGDQCGLLMVWTRGR